MCGANFSYQHNAPLIMRSSPVTIASRYGGAHSGESLTVSGILYLTHAALPLFRYVIASFFYLFASALAPLEKVAKKPIDKILLCQASTGSMASMASFDSLAEFKETTPLSPPAAE